MLVIRTYFDGETARNVGLLVATGSSPGVSGFASTIPGPLLDAVRLAVKFPGCSSISSQTMADAPRCRPHNDH